MDLRIWYVVPVFISIWFIYAGRPQWVTVRDRYNELCEEKQGRDNSWMLVIVGMTFAVFALAISGLMYELDPKSEALYIVCAILLEIAVNYLLEKKYKYDQRKLMEGK